MAFSVRWRDILALIVAINLAFVSLKNSGISSKAASVRLYAYADFDAFFQYPTVPLTIPLAKPEIIYTNGKADNGVEGLILAGIARKDKQSVGTLKFIDVNNVWQNAGKSTDGPTYMMPNEKSVYRNEDSSVPVRIVVDNDSLRNENGVVNIATLWSDASVSSHSLAKINNDLDWILTLNWKVNLAIDLNFGMNDRVEALEFVETAMLFVNSSVLGDKTRSNLLIIGVSTKMHSGSDMDVDNTMSNHFSYYALSTEDGKFVWKHTKPFGGSSFEKEGKQHSDENNGPKHTATSKSRFEIYREEVIRENQGDESEETEACLNHFRLSTKLSAFPHFWKTIEDTELKLASFERNQRAFKHAKIKNKVSSPNVIVSHTHKGIEVISLSSGLPICHLSLLENVYYDDIEGNGRIDQIHLIESYGTELPNEIHWTPTLMESFRAATDGVENRQMDQPKKLPPCQVIALSGIPVRDYIYNRSLCGRMKKNPSAKTNSLSTAQNSKLIDIAPPFSIGQSDIIFSVNSGTITRIASDGTIKFQTKGSPVWDSSIFEYSAVGIIESDNMKDPSNQPIITSGEDELVILSAHGKVLGRGNFPQQPIYRPILVDLDRDGTTDVLSVSAEGIWLLVIDFSPSSNWLILLNFLLFLLMAASLYTNRSFGRRGTDYVVDKWR